jgi:PPK2 family polyphosphate:nucleotide phosphotransferase
MFAAKPHSLLVPFDGSFDARKAQTDAPKGKDKDECKERLADETKKLGEAQERLYADGRYGVLIVLQALDAAGKDGTIRHVFAGVNPSGLRVAAFKQPTPLELAHDFLWRTTQHLPERGNITIFNRSYYEEVLVVRVHPEFLAAQHLPDKPSAKLWADRLRAIADHERYLAEQGTVILKFWLNVSRAEQRKRFLERIDDAKKNWKFNPGDLDERDRWDDYISAYEECLRATSRPWAPWYAIPADDKHYQRWQVAKLITSALDELKCDFPRPDEKARAALTKAKARLLAQSD